MSALLYVCTRFQAQENPKNVSSFVQTFDSSLKPQLLFIHWHLFKFASYEILLSALIILKTCYIS